MLMKMKRCILLGLLAGFFTISGVMAQTMQPSGPVGIDRTSDQETQQQPPEAKKVPGDRVLSLGQDLTDEQRSTIAAELGVKREDLFSPALPTIVVSNEEERKALSGLVSYELIGSRALSSALVELTNPGSGITVTTKRITWVTPEIYANSLVTAGVKDAKVTVAAPTDVSGTAALTGIMKAFERATGNRIDDSQQRIANKELVKTGELGNEIGNKDKAAKLVASIKERVAAQESSDPERIRVIIQDTARDNDITLTTKQVDQLAELMAEIKQLNLQASDIKQQLSGLNSKVVKISDTAKETKGILERIFDFFKSIFSMITSLIGALTRR